MVLIQTLLSEMGQVLLKMYLSIYGSYLLILRKAEGNMMNIVRLFARGFLVLALLAAMTGWAAAEVPSISTWSKTYGGGGSDIAYSMDKTLDGGVIVAGQTASFGAGGTDAWIQKLHSDGSVDWQRSYGGTADDYASSIKATADGGYVVAGVTGCSGSNTTPCVGDGALSS